MIAFKGLMSKTIVRVYQFCVYLEYFLFCSVCLVIYVQITSHHRSKNITEPTKERHENVVFYKELNQHLKTTNH